MRLFRYALFTCLVVCSGSAAWAQYGLYGSPDVLRVPAQAGATGDAATAAYPTTAAPSQPAPAYSAQPQQYSYPAQPQQYNYPQQPPYRPAQPAAPQASYPSPYRYPAQATAMYQPYQPGAQYRYPGPNRPPVRGGGISQPAQTIPAPRPLPPGPLPVPDSMPSASELPPTSPPMDQNNAYFSGENPAAADNGSGVYRGSVGRYEQAACGPNAEACGYDGCTGTYCPWYVGASALVLGRSDSRRLWTSYATDNEVDQLTNSDFGMSWKVGGEIVLGRRFCWGCVPYALQGTFWTSEAFSNCVITTNPNDPYTVSTPLVVNPMTFGGVPAQNWFDGAKEHRLWRRDEFYNIEVNLIREQLAWACDSPWDIGWSVGLRFFRFEDDLRFGSLMVGHNWGDGGGQYEAYFSDNIQNNLVGVQFGFNAAYSLCNSLRLFITPQVGIYNNFMESDFQARTGNGINGAGPYGTFPVHASANGVSFLTQIDLGLDYQFTRNWSARLGYRVVAVTGVGLADDQFPQYMVDMPAIADIEHTSSLVLHGGFLGLTYNF